MAVIATSKPKEDFIVQINGEYGIPFDEQVLADAVVSGQVIANGAGFAIAAGALGEHKRVMVRGNPTSVNAQALTGYVALTHKAALASVGILVVNE